MTSSGGGRDANLDASVTSLNAQGAVLQGLVGAMSTQIALSNQLVEAQQSTSQQVQVVSTEVKQHTEQLAQHDARLDQLGGRLDEQETGAHQLAQMLKQVSAKLERQEVLQDAQSRCFDQMRSCLDTLAALRSNTGAYSQAQTPGQGSSVARAKDSRSVDSAPARADPEMQTGTDRAERRYNDAQMETETASVERPVLQESAAQSIKASHLTSACVQTLSGASGVDKSASRVVEGCKAAPSRDAETRADGTQEPRSGLESATPPRPARNDGVFNDERSQHSSPEPSGSSTRTSSSPQEQQPEHNRDTLADSSASRGAAANEATTESPTPLPLPALATPFSVSALSSQSPFTLVSAAAATSGLGAPTAPVLPALPALLTSPDSLARTSRASSSASNVANFMAWKLHFFELPHEERNKERRLALAARGGDALAPDVLPTSAEVWSSLTLSERERWYSLFRPPAFPSAMSAYRKRSAADMPAGDRCTSQLKKVKQEQGTASFAPTAAHQAKSGLKLRLRLNSKRANPAVPSCWNAGVRAG